MPPLWFVVKNLSLILVFLSIPCSGYTSDPATARQWAKNWFSIATHLQNPTLYSADWAHACAYTNHRLVTCREVQEGEIISLVPIHAIGLNGYGPSGPSKDWLIYDQDQDGDYFRRATADDESLQDSFGGSTVNKQPDSPGGQSKFHYRLGDLVQQTKLLSSVSSFAEQASSRQVDFRQSMFYRVNPTRPLQSGWMGHLAQPAKHLSLSNCMVVPLAYPLCGLVATANLRKDCPLLSVPLDNKASKPVLNMEKVLGEDCLEEVNELRNYMEMARPEYSQEHSEEVRPEQVEENIEDDQHTNTLLHPFYPFPRDEGRVHYLSKDPDILAIPNFLTDDECDRLIEKAKLHLVPCVTKDPKTGAIQQHPSRTSRNANIPQREIPTIVDKITQLTNCTKEQLELIQILHYERGQYFGTHTDGFWGPVSACGFEESARLVTIFCYLNKVDNGGETRFGALDLEVAPERGLAVIHFPTTVGFEEDVRTEHESKEAIDDKWLLVTWVWMHERDQLSDYSEEYLEPLNGDIV